MNYYNEFDDYCADWLENLIAEGLIPNGHVDRRSIADVQPKDLAGYRQCHFFAGIGGWALAARLAGWPDDRQLWTGSPPCQPFSVAGRQLGTDDERHLWPHQLRLLRARRPAVWMGEQVAAAVGKDWLDGVLSELESIDYAGRAAVVPACAVDGPHRRDRLWIVAERNDHVADAASAGSQGCWSERATRQGSEGSTAQRDSSGVFCGAVAHDDQSCASEGRQQRGGELGGTRGDPGARSAWASAVWIIGHDGKARRVGTRVRRVADGLPAGMAGLRAGDDAAQGEVEMIPLLAHGVQARVGKLRAFGNAIVPQVAAEVIAAYMEDRDARALAWAERFDFSFL